MSDSQQGLNKQFALTDLLRQSVYGRLAGYEDVKNAERLAANTPIDWLANSLCPRPEKRTMHQSKGQIGSSG